MTVLEALDLPDGHIRTVTGICEKCGNQRFFIIKADDPLVPGEDSMFIIDFLNNTLSHCEDYHFQLTEEERRSRQAIRHKVVN
jgi:hypothetical protein